MMGNASKAVWDSYIHSNELEMERQYQRDIVIIDMWEYFSSNPLIAVDVVTGTVGLGTTLVGIAATAGIASIPIAGQVPMGVVSAVCTVWGICRVIVTVFEDLCGGE